MVTTYFFDFNKKNNDFNETINYSTIQTSLHEISKIYFFSFYTLIDLGVITIVKEIKKKKTLFWTSNENEETIIIASH